MPEYVTSPMVDMLTSSHDFGLIVKYAVADPEYAFLPVTVIIAVPTLRLFVIFNV